MHPMIFGWRAYPAFIVIAVVTGIVATILCARRAGITAGRIVLVQLLLPTAALAGAKAWAIVESGQRSGLWRLIFSLDNFRYPGGLAAAIVALPLIAMTARIPLAELADVVAAPIAGAMAVMRVGCLLQGCCFGVLAPDAIGLRFPAYSPAWNEHLVQGLIDLHAPASLPVHALQIYFGVWSLLVAALLVAWWPRRQHAGQVFLLLLLLHEGGKATLESLRVPPRPPLQQASAVAAGAGAVGLMAGLVVRHRRRRHEIYP